MKALLTLFLLASVLCGVAAPPLAAPSVAAPQVAVERTYAWLSYFIGPCRDYNVPLALALAIARQESGTRPWVINVAGQGYFPQTRQEARAIADRAWSQGQSFDVGIMQVNSYWLKKYHIAVEEILEPRNNIAMGVWILAKEIQRYGLTWQAVGAYHTPLARNPERAKAYALNVIAHMRAICDKDKAMREQVQRREQTTQTREPLREQVAQSHEQTARR